MMYTNAGFKLEREFDYEGLKCLVVGLVQGHRCGYVGIDKSHPLFGKNYHEVEVSAHGGITFAGNIPVYGDLWFFGFDCGHLIDGMDYELIKELGTLEYYEFMSPLNDMFSSIRFGPIRTTEFVERECISLAKQLIQARGLL